MSAIASHLLCYGSKAEFGVNSQQDADVMLTDLQIDDKGLFGSQAQGSLSNRSVLITLMDTFYQTDCVKWVIQMIMLRLRLRAA